APSLCGCATWAATESEVLARIPAKIEEYVEWLRGHGEITHGFDGTVEVVERIRGDEVLFTSDRVGATPEEVSRATKLLGWTRDDLLATLSGLPPQALDWDPPHRPVPRWAQWRTARQILRHIALTEVGYYLSWIGYPAVDPGKIAGEWRRVLDDTRAETLRFLREVRGSTDRLRLAKRGGEEWSVRKVLRRLVWHERIHTKSIRRILRRFREAGKS
ncbi:MAG: DinB family protein, partial [Planctomycetota bacterium]